MVHKDCREFSYLDGVIFVTLYDEIIEKLMHDVKYNFCFDILTQVSKMMSDFFKYYKFENIILTSVPLHSKKKNFRGFNQSEVMVKHISSRLSLEYYEILKRNRYTKTQVGLDKVAREQNLKEAFNIQIHDKAIMLKDIIIVDDVYTTGTTLNECAKVLKSAGFGKVYGFVFARAGLK